MNISFEQMQNINEVPNEKEINDPQKNTDVIEITEVDKNLIIICAEEAVRYELANGYDLKAEISQYILDKLRKLKKKEVDNNTFTKSIFL